MTSVRVGAGYYVVLGTTYGVEVVKRARDWELIVDGVPTGRRFPTKRAALQACQCDPTL